MTEINLDRKIHDVAVAFTLGSFLFMFIQNMATFKHIKKLKAL